MQENSHSRIFPNENHVKVRINMAHVHIHILWGHVQCTFVIAINNYRIYSNGMYDPI